jgi:branched-chain amino acid transport system substrate-binding protein
MREIPVEDVIFGRSVIRVDGRVIHPVYLFEAKKPSESVEPWDLLTLKATVPIDQAFRPLNEGGCPLVHV